MREAKTIFASLYISARLTSERKLYYVADIWCQKRLELNIFKKHDEFKASEWDDTHVTEWAVPNKQIHNGFVWEKNNI